MDAGIIPATIPIVIQIPTASVRIFIDIKDFEAKC
jgi:hypothetical protein